MLVCLINTLSPFSIFPMLQGAAAQRAPQMPPRLMMRLHSPSMNGEVSMYTKLVGACSVNFNGNVKGTQVTLSEIQ